MHLKWRKQMMIFILRVPCWIYRSAVQLLRRAALSIASSISCCKSKALIDERPRQYRFPRVRVRNPGKNHRISAGHELLDIHHVETLRVLSCAICKSTMNKASEFII
jgi:hypothetical protein